MGRDPDFYRSIEHNIDMFAYGRIAGDSQVQASARKFVKNMARQNGKIYALGTGGGQRCATSINTQTVATDSITWNIAADVDDDLETKKAGLGFAIDPNGLWETEQDPTGNGGKGVGLEYNGVRFSENGKNIQWENTAGLLTAMKRYIQLHPDDMALADKIQTIEASLTSLLNIYGHIPASIQPEGSESGVAESWNYPPVAHLVATAWTGIVLMDKNPYSEAANRPDSTSCGGPGPAPTPPPTPPPPGSAACTEHSQCAALGLEGNCCPTDNTGTMLDCCTR